MIVSFNCDREKNFQNMEVDLTFTGYENHFQNTKKTGIFLPHYNFEKSVTDYEKIKLTVSKYLPYIS